MTPRAYWESLTTGGRRRLEKRCGLSINHMSQIFLGKREPSGRTLARLNAASQRITLKMFYPEYYS